jgi:XTP/dITP diphosphohydrolase
LKLVLASNNPKKLVELQALLAAAGVVLVAQPQLGIGEAEEPHETFVENALAKARHAARHAGAPAIADDSGLCVHALGGAPGVRSARYASHAAESPQREVQRAQRDAANNALLLQRMAGVVDRRAWYVAALVAVRDAQDPEPLVAVGRWRGSLLESPSGAGGFGYDPLVYVPELGASVAQLDAGVKNAHSHRAKAARDLLRQMLEVWGLG